MLPDADSPLLESGRFAGREAFAQLVRDAFSCAAQQGWREIIISDANFEDWPLRERLVVDSLRAWSKTGRRLLMLASRYDAVMRDQARFVAWRKTWSHIIDCRVCRHIDPVDFPSAIWSPVWAMRRLDVLHSAGVCGVDPARRLSIGELLNEMQLNSSPGFPASTLGL